MRHPIDPKVDCVFKALLGAESNRALLIHFLNSVLARALPGPITEVTILNPYNEREFSDDKLSVVALKVFSERERAYHSYQARQNYLREQRSVQRHLDDLNVQIEDMRAAEEQARVAMDQARMAMEQERVAKEQAWTAMEQERVAKEDALAEIERLKRLLGEGPDS